MPTARAAARPGHASAAGTSELDDTLLEIVRDIQDELRQLTRLLTSPESHPEDPLRWVVQIGSQLEGLTAGMVGRTRRHRVTWQKIGRILRVGEDTARHRYTDRYIQRRLAQLIRPNALPALSALYTNTPDPGGQETTAPPPTEDPPNPPAHPAYNRLAPVLSMLARASNLTSQTLSHRIGCSASYLSRMLNGERVPTWPLTERFAKACGADPVVLRKVWETERLRQNDPEPADHPPRGLNDTDPARRLQRLLTSLRTLHIRASLPTPYDIAVASRWQITPEQVDAILTGTDVTHWDHINIVLQVLGGDVDYFRALWEACDQPPTLDENPIAQGSPAERRTTSEGLHTTLEQFKDVLVSPPPLKNEQREAILQARREAIRNRLNTGHRTPARLATRPTPIAHLRT